MRGEKKKGKDMRTKDREGEERKGIIRDEHGR